MLNAAVWRRVTGVDRRTVIEEIDFDEESETVVVHVRPRKATKRRCGRCGRRAPGYDQGEGRPDWRTLDLGTLMCTKLLVLHRMAFGFRRHEHLIALALLDRGGYCPALPGRSASALAVLG